MSLIEGIGDEVIVVFGVVFVLFVVVLAWLSTNIRDIPFFSVIIVELTQRRRRQTANTSDQNQAPQSEDPHTEQQLSEAASTSGNVTELSSDANVSTNTEPEQEIIDHPASAASKSQEEDGVSGMDGGQSRINSTMSISGSGDDTDNTIDKSREDASEEIILKSEEENLSEMELRRRRVAFFEQGKSNDCDGSEVNKCTDTKQSRPPLVSDKNTNGLEKVDSNIQVQSTDSSDTPVTIENSNSSQARSDMRQESLGASTAEIRDGEVELRSGQIRIRLKYLNDDQRNVVASPNDTIGQFRRANFATELAENKLVRFIFNGRDLRNDSSTLQANDVVDNSVLHCLITQVNNQVPPPHHEAERGFDMGSLLLPIFGIVLLVMWYMRFEYRQLFTATSTISLIGITALYIAGLLASWESYRRDNGHEHIE